MAELDVIRLGVVGAGNIASQHLQVLRHIRGIEVAGITSRTREKAELLASEFEIQHVADNLKDLVEDVRPDGLLILVSIAQMFEATKEAIQFGLPLFIEKPPGLLPNETEQLAKDAHDKDVRTMVGFNRRHYSIFHKGLQLIREHGPLMGILVEGHERIEAVRKSSMHSEQLLASWLYANSTHTIDLMRFFGGEVEKVDSITHRYREPLGDQFAAIVNYSSGTMGTYVANWLSPGGWRVVLYGDGVRVDFQPLETGRWTDKNYQIHEIEPDKQDIDHKPGFYNQMLAFCDLVRGASLQWPSQDLDAAYETMCLARRLAESVVDRTQV
jgi:predicted dehydrogenase